MNTLLLTPTDVLFFRDGRPMSGSLSGHGAAWPLPTVTNAALHAALHRSEIQSHSHRRGCSGDYEETRDRKFGSLLTAGPFPVLDAQWLFPRPLDAGLSKAGEDATAPTFLPLAKDFTRAHASLPPPLQYPVASTLPPSKASPAPWWTVEAWRSYLAGSDCQDRQQFKMDSDFADTESTYGIGIDPVTDTQDGQRFYSAHYLRLRPSCHLGLLASACDKKFRDPATSTNDLIQALFPNSDAETPIITGGQQRLCTVRRDNPANQPLPTGKADTFTETETGFLVKWVLLTPAIFPEITAGTSKRGTERKAHHGGWLPTWICPDTGKVLLQTIDSAERKRRRSLNASGKGYPSTPNISATLVAALTGKPVPVSGYALDTGLDERKPGPKPTHFAVPAGSIYYFECTKADAAKKLATALNWHGDGDATTIRNRRSTLMGEKGFGLGVCGTWQFHEGNPPH